MTNQKSEAGSQKSAPTATLNNQESRTGVAVPTDDLRPLTSEPKEEPTPIPSKEGKPKGEPTPDPSTEGKPEPKADQPKPLLDDKGDLTVAGVEFLSLALAFASRGLEQGLQAFIVNAIEPGQAQRGELENAYEAARAAIHGRSNVGHLVSAQRALETTALILANHSLKDVRCLAVAKEAAQDAKTALKKLVPSAECQVSGT